MFTHCPRVLSPQLCSQCFGLDDSDREREMETVSSSPAGRHWPGLCFILVLADDVSLRCPFFSQEKCTWLDYTARVGR